MGPFDAMMKRLHRVFNKDPKLAAVLFLSPGQYPASYTVKDGIFTYAVNGQPVYVKALDGLTIQDLVTDINVFFGYVSAYDDGSPVLYDDGTPFFCRDGFAATVVAPAFANYLAIGLYEAQQDLADDGKVYFPTAGLYNEFQTYAITLKEQEEHRNAAERELYAHTADGTWLDFWLSYFDMFRLGGEGDLAFFTRALAEVLSPRVNNEALAIILERSLGFTVDVKDLGTETIELFMTNNPLSVMNDTEPSDILFNNQGLRPKGGMFGVYLYSGSVNDLAPAQKTALVALVNRCKASGKVAGYYAPTGQVITNSSVSLLNNHDFATGPVPNGWVQVVV